MKKSLLISCLTACLLMVSCQEDPEPIDPPGGTPVPTGDFETKNLQVMLPQGSSFEIKGGELFSFGEAFPISDERNTSTVSTPGSASVAYVFDSSDNLVLAGFISDTVSSVSPQSTANVLLSYAIGASLREKGFVSLFLDQINQLPEAIAWQEQFTELWKNDPLILEKGAYTAQLREVMEKLVPEARVIDIRANAKISDISVDEGDLKSGIQVSDDGLGQFSVNNRYRRRAHGFLYKMSYKDNSGQSHQILSAVGPTSSSDRDFAVSPTAAATSVIGVLGSAIEGNQGDVAEVKSGPFKLDLEENESEATYKLHVVGPGKPLQLPVTEAEKSKHERLTIETFVIDFMFPLIMEIYGWKDDLLKEKINIGSGPIEKFIGATEVFLKATPEVYETVKSGDYLGASKKALELLYTGTVEGKLEDLSLLAFDVMADAATLSGVKIPNSASANAQKIIGKGAKILQVLNTAMLAGDFIRISDGIESSRNLEDWTIKARSTQVTLLPKEATVRSRGHKEITAKIKNLEEQGDTHPYFVWKTSGKYGYIQDTKGNRGESFDSSDPKVTYYSTTNANLLEQENNWEYVYVEAFLGSQSLGKDTVKLNLRKSVYEIKPNGVTVSGKKGSANSAKLHIEATDGSVVDFSDKKVVWTTGGQYGKLKGPGGFSTAITTFGTNSIHYECTDKDTEKATEKVYARIYAKSAVDNDYFLYEELEATININNEDDVIIKYVPISTTSWNATTWGTTCGSGSIFYIDPEPNAESYTATVIDFSREVIPRVTGTTRSWSASAATNEDGKYEFAYVLASAGSDPSKCGEFKAAANSRKGMARVIIKLKKQ